MAYMCTDSGNLMAIAQQVIKQKQQQEQQHQQQHHHHHHQDHQIFPLSFNPWPTPTIGFGLSGSGLPDPFQVTAGGDGFPFPNLDPGGGFQLSDFGGGTGGEFESDEWMETLINGGDSVGPDCDTWHNNPDYVINGPDPFVSYPTRLSVQPSDLNRVIDTSSPLPHPPPVSSLWPPSSPLSIPPPPHETVAKEDLETNDSEDDDFDLEPPLLRTIFDCIRISDSDADEASKAVVRIRESVSELGDPTERVGFYFTEALCNRLSPTDSPSASPSSLEDLILAYKTLNDACPYSKFAHLTANRF